MIQNLLDTNVVSELSKPRPNTVLMLAFGTQRDNIAIASVTLHEIRFGIERVGPSAKRDLLENFFQDTVLLLPVLPYDDKAALWHAIERARLTSIGKTPTFADGQIAAVAAVNQLTLVTANVSDFANFEGLNIEDWTRRK
jgi:tRNA(fMet)-specific endonuclease VapC